MKLAKLFFIGMILTSRLAVAADSESVSEPSAAAERSPSAEGGPSNATTSGEGLDEVIQKVLKIVIDKTAAAKGRVAIMDFPSLETGRLTALSAYIANKAGNRMIEANRQVVDRGALEKIIREQKLQQNALMDAATAAKVGRLAGAGVFVIGNYSILKKKFAITVRALSVETGQFVAAAEETIAFNPDLKSEVDELHAKNMATVASPNLDGESGDEGGGAATHENSKQTAEFDRKVCAMVSKGLPVLKIYKEAFDKDILDLSTIGEDGITGINHSDASGEEQGPAYQLGDWWILINSWGVNRSAVGAAYKGKIDGYYRIDGWLYEGSTSGMEPCVSKVGWWTSERPFSAKPKKKKK